VTNHEEARDTPFDKYTRTGIYEGLYEKSRYREKSFPFDWSTRRTSRDRSSNEIDGQVAVTINSLAG